METPSISKSMGYTASMLDLDPGNDLHKLLRQQQVLQQPLGGRTFQAGAATHPVVQQVKEENMTRIVRVIIADANENLPLENRILYKSEEKLTDLTDQELFFEVPMAELLSKHNEVRSKTVDKAVKDRTEYLSPARIRDLKMLVIDIAKF